MTKTSIISKILTLVIPLVAVYLTWIKCPLQRENTPVYKALVTPDVVSLVIFIFGLAFCRSLETSILDFVFNCVVLLLICIWIVVYSRSCSGNHTEKTMKLSLCLLILSLLLVFTNIVTTIDASIRIFLIPLAIWLLLLITHQTQRKSLGASKAECSRAMCDTIV